MLLNDNVHSFCTDKIWMILSFFWNFLESRVLELRVFKKTNVQEGLIKKTNFRCKILDKHQYSID